MDSEKIEKLRERLLQCAVCMEEFKDPRILPCHHTLCMECIQKLSESSPSYAGFSCPHCRSNVPVPLRGIRDLPINFYIINLQEELSTTGYTEKCNICERDWLISQFRCVDCDLDICRFCIHAHRLETHTEPPTILRIETKASHFQYASNRFCLEHTDEILQMYCSTCCQAICITCSCNDHKKHVVVPIALKLQESKTYLQSELDRLTSEKASATKVSDSLKNTLAGVTESSSRSLMTLDSATLRAYRMLLKKQHDIEKKILQSEKEQVDNIVSVMKECDLYSKRINNALAFLTDLQESDICLELLDTYKDFLTKVESMRNELSANKIRLREVCVQAHNFMHISDINLGMCRKWYFFGKLLDFSEQNFHVSFNSRTLQLKKQPKGLSHIMRSTYFQSICLFFALFTLFQILFFIGDISGITSGVTEMISSLFLVGIKMWNSIFNQAAENRHQLGD